MDAEKANHSIVTMARVLGISRSGYYDWRQRRHRRQPRQALRIEAVKAIHRRKRGAVGSRQMAIQLQRRGHPVGRYQARSLMRHAGVVCRQRRRYKTTTDSDHNQRVAPNRLNCQFAVDRINTVWCADITTIWTQIGWLYLAAVLDLADRQCVGWAMADHMQTELATRALHMALGRRQPKAGLMHHSDRGSHYAARAYQAVLEQHGMVVSMSRKGNCWDNSPMERFFGTLKSEWTDDQRYANRQQAKRDIVEFIEMEYNSDRSHSTNEGRTPREQELAAVA